MRSILLCMVVAASGCFLDPTCKDSCDGDRIVSCKWKCSGQGKIDIPECERQYGGANCAERMGLSGRPMSCRMSIIEPSNSSPISSPACVDLGSPCDPSAQAVCTGEHSAAACVKTSEGGFLQPQVDAVCESPPGEGCHDRPFGVMCVPLPKQFCDPSLFPSCNPDGGYDTCQGTPDAGFVLTPGACSASLSCTGDAGSAFCR